MPLISYKHLGRYTTTERIVIIPDNPEKIALDIPIGTRLDKLQDMDTEAIFWFNPVKMYFIPDNYQMHIVTEEDD